MMVPRRDYRESSVKSDQASLIALINLFDRYLIKGKQNMDYAKKIYTQEL